MYEEKKDGAPIINDRSAKRATTKTERDIELVKRHTKIVLDIDTLETIQNPPPLIGAFAVIGNRDGKKMILLEIGGLGKHIPYHRSWIKEDGINLNIPPRKRLSPIDSWEYEGISPFIFQTLQKLTDSAAAEWKSLYANIPAIIWQMVRKKGVTVPSFRKTIESWPNGLKFSVSKEDKDLVADIFWAELFNNQRLRQYLSNEARLIHGAIADKYKQRYRSEHGDWWAEDKQNLFETYSFQAVRRRLRGMTCLRESPYLFHELMRLLPKGRKSPLWPLLYELLGKEMVETTEERKMAKAALPETDRRTRGMQLRVTSGLNTPKDHIVFRVWPTQTNLSA